MKAKSLFGDHLTFLKYALIFLCSGNIGVQGLGQPAHGCVFQVESMLTTPIKYRSMAEPNKTGIVGLGPFRSRSVFDLDSK